MLQYAGIITKSKIASLMLKSKLMRRARSAGDFRKYKEFDNHEMVIGVTDQASGLKAYIGIHNTNLGPASGGTRMKAYDSDDDAIRDVLNLSKAMSYKCAMANLPFGGGKAVIIDSGNLDRNSVLEAYAKMVGKLNGLYKTGPDVGLNEIDVNYMSQFTEHILGVGGDRGGLSTSTTAALGTNYAIKAVIQELYGEDDLRGKSIAVKGIGKLGGSLVEMLHKEGALLIIADLDNDKALNLAKRLGGIKVVDSQEIHMCQVDVYAPCALGNEFTPSVIKELRCRAIAGGANNQLPSSLAGESLHNNGIVYAPDYIVNAGGLIYVSDQLEPGGFNKERVLQRTQAISQTLSDIFTRSKIQKLPPHLIADHIAQERINEGRL